MNWLDRMNAALDYIEANLAGTIDMGIAARGACCSEYHFTRMFSFIVGVPISEYIRRGRLTLAGCSATRVSFHYASLVYHILNTQYIDRMQTTNFSLNTIGIHLIQTSNPNGCWHLQIRILPMLQFIIVWIVCPLRMRGHF